MKELLKNNFAIQSYIDENREKIDESLVSLRFMKEIDNFLDVANLSQREFASSIGYSEAYISQLMAGTKKFNSSFINKFEKKYDVEISFKIKSKDEESYFTEFSSSSSIQIINVNVLAVMSADNIYSFENKYQNYFKLESDHWIKLTE